MTFDIAQFKDAFLSEAEDNLARLDSNLLALEKSIKKNYKAKVLSQPFREGDAKLLDELMRSAHTVKSSAATMSYSQIAFLMHVLEDVFDYARNNLLKINQKMIDEIFSAFDMLNSSLKKIKTSGIELDLAKSSDRIKKLTGVATEGLGKSIRDLSGKPLAVKKNKSNKILSVQNSKNLKNLEGIEKIIDSNETEEISHIKVPVKRIDSLLDLTEEILIEKMRIAEILQSFHVELAKEKKFLKTIGELEALFERLSLSLSSLQYEVMEARLVPVEMIFSRFPRMVRDLAKNLGKEADLETKGGELEVDRSMIDKLAEPLVHLLKNAIDHGIGKKGKIVMTAKREKEYISIAVEDDGPGIDWQAVANAAIIRNIISQGEGVKLLEAIKNRPQAEWRLEIEALLYHPRLSTKKQVTETSGRGVGLSVVENFAKSVRGSVKLTSPAKGKIGTRFEMQLPLTLAIIDSLLVKISDQVFAIPFMGIKRIVSVASADIKSAGDENVAIIDNDKVPLADLKKMFNFNLITGQGIKKLVNESDNLKNLTMVLMKRGDEIAGLVVDKVLSQQQIIVKPLPVILKGLSGFSGSTILGNGEVALIIDVISLLKDSNKLLRI